LVIRGRTENRAKMGIFASLGYPPLCPKLLRSYTPHRMLPTNERIPHSSECTAHTTLEFHKSHPEIIRTTFMEECSLHSSGKRSEPLRDDDDTAVSPAAGSKMAHTRNPASHTFSRAAKISRKRPLPWIDSGRRNLWTSGLLFA